MRSTVWILVLVFATALTAVPVGPTAAQPVAARVTDEPSDQEPTDTIDDGEIPGLGNIIGSPDAGPDPEDPGDRGGYAQLLLAAIMIGGVGFILRKIFREVSGPG